ncbi:serine hydrolase [Streptomyces antnestii]|uniref:serine hydrolase n=1 Tax=Streptomyces antnestii TaxID=2494256 RepID=UPI001CB8FB09|nr:serine hydrolase [Streptomyces sp. San01]
MTSVVGVGADDPVVLVSVFKTPVAVAFTREVAAGRLDETERPRLIGCCEDLFAR